MIRGIDVSEHQRGLNITATGTQVCLIKASEGEGYRDPLLATHIASVRAGGIKAGFYHMARPTPENDPIREADWFLTVIGPHRLPGDILALDWERENPHNTAWAKAFLDRLRERTDAVVWVYMNTFTARAYDWSSIRAEYPLWQADYNAERGAVPGWSLAAWQYTDTGRLPGYGAALDLNHVYSTEGGGMPRFIVPTDRPVTQSWAAEFYWFLNRYYPQGFYHFLGWLGHNGIDYGCWVGDPVYASADGVVEYVGSGDGHRLLSGGGNVIMLNHGDVRTAYLHLNGWAVTRAGVYVRQGQIIGYAGMTGTVTAPHLHFEFIPLDGQLNINNGYRGRISPDPWLFGTVLPAGGPVGPDWSDDVALTAKQAEALELIGRLLPRMNQVSEALDVRTGHPTQGALKKAADVILNRVNMTNWKDGSPMLIAAQGDIDSLRTRPARFFKAKGVPTIYELAGGELRGMTRAEWVLHDAAGEDFLEVDPEIINDMLKD